MTHAKPKFNRFGDYQFQLFAQQVKYGRELLQVIDDPDKFSVPNDNQVVNIGGPETRFERFQKSLQTFVGVIDLRRYLRSQKDQLRAELRGTAKRH